MNSENRPTSKNQSHYRLKATVRLLPTDDADEGIRAAWWRENIMKMSRPQLAEILGINPRTIERYEASKNVPVVYRLACETLNHTTNPTWSWQTITRPRSIARGLARAYDENIG